MLEYRTEIANLCTCNNTNEKTARLIQCPFEEKVAKEKFEGAKTLNWNKERPLKLRRLKYFKKKTVKNKNKSRKHAGVCDQLFKVLIAKLNNKRAKARQTNSAPVATSENNRRKIM